jgi:hypothetical protein
MSKSVKNKSSKKEAKAPFGTYTEWRIICTQQRKYAHELLNDVLSKHGLQRQTILTVAIMECYNANLIDFDAKEKLDKINENGKIARHDWTTMYENIMNKNTIVYTQSVIDPSFEPPSYEQVSNIALDLYNMSTNIHFDNFTIGTDYLNVDLNFEPSNDYFQCDFGNISPIHEITGMLCHREIAKLLDNNDMIVDSSYQVCLDDCKKADLVNEQDYKKLKSVNKKANKSKHNKNKTVEA